MNVRDFPITIIMFSLVIVGAGLIMADIYGSYGVTPIDMPDSFDQMQEIQEDTQTMQDAIGESSAEPEGVFEFFSKGAWKTVKISLNSGNLIKNIAEESGTQFGVPNVFVQGFLIIIMLSLVFSIISVIFRRKA